MQFDIRRLDIYRKIPKDLTEPTSTGACISVCSILFIIFLFISELTDFLDPDIESQMFVDDPSKDLETRIPVKIDISLPKLDCRYIGLDIQDDLGRHEVGFVDNTEKMPMNNGAGCRFTAEFKINKVPGNFHISTHAAREQPPSPDMTHIINHLTFGDAVSPSWGLPGTFDPMQNRDKTDGNGLSSHDYVLKVVPTVFENVDGEDELRPYQFTYAYRDYIQYGHGHRVSPAIWFRYDLSPITVKYHQRGKHFYSFLTTVCAIIGGTFTVAGIIDSMLFTATALFKKAELGKLS